jgi:hypothetical protein
LIAPNEFAQRVARNLCMPVKYFRFDVVREHYRWHGSELPAQYRGVREVEYHDIRLFGEGERYG